MADFAPNVTMDGETVRELASRGMHINAFDTGTVITRALGPALLVDFADPGAQTVPERAVAYDIERGWDAGGAPWARPVEEGENLIPLLIRQWSR